MDDLREEMVDMLMEADYGLRRRALVNMGFTLDEKQEEFELKEVVDLIDSIPDEELKSLRPEAYKASAPRTEATFKFDGTGVPMGIAAEPYIRAIVEHAYQGERDKLSEDKIIEV